MEFQISRLVIIGDIAFETDHINSRVETSIGGGGYYSSFAASRYLKNVGVVATVGLDFPLHSLKRLDLNLSGVTVDPDLPTARFDSYHLNDTERVFKADRAAAAKFSKIPEIYLEADHIHLATSTPHNYLYWINILKEANYKGQVSADAFEEYVDKFPEMILEVYQETDLFFLNDYEYSILSKRLSYLPDKPMVLKHGKLGATYINGAQQMRSYSPVVEVVDTTGAGDVLAGTFLAHKVRGDQPSIALDKAVLMASRSVTNFGVDHLFAE